VNRVSRSSQRTSLTTSTHAESRSTRIVFTAPVCAFASRTSIWFCRRFIRWINSSLELLTPAQSIRARYWFLGSPSIASHRVAPPSAATTPIRPAEFVPPAFGYCTGTTNE
jgi:hypothetical protein